MSDFHELPSEQKTSILTLRDQTTYLWPEIERLCHHGGDACTCQIREQTYDTIREALATLRDSGCLDFNKTPRGNSGDQALLRLQIHDVSDPFKQAVVSMATDSPSASQGGFRRGLARIRAFFFRF